MSNVAYTYLSESFLFREDSLSDQFSSITDSEVQAELVRYREYILRSQRDLENEATGDDSRLAIYFETVGRNRPSVDLLKQCGLYFDVALVDDPLFALTVPLHPQGEAATQLLGYNQRQAVERQKVLRTVLFMKALTPMVAADFLKFIPVSLQHESPPEIPVRYSETLFIEGIPKDLRTLFARYASVHSLQKSEGGWSFREGEPLVPSRGIHVEFQGLAEEFVYHLFASKSVSFDDETVIARVMNWLPEEPPETEQFRTWVTQSVNQASQRVLLHLVKDVTNAGLLRSLLLTSSPFAAKVLAADPRTTTSLEADLARLALQVDVPVLTSVTVADLMRVRMQNGEAFQNFRRALQRKVRDLRNLDDPSALAGKLEEASHELTELQVQDVAASIRRLKRELTFEGLVAVASLAAIIPTGGMSLLPLMVAGSQASATLNRYLGEAKAHPAYFLWRLQEQAQKKADHRPTS